MTDQHMSEPISSTAGSIAGWKLIGGLAGLGAIGAGLASMVVMCMTPPRTHREWAVGVTCTVMGSVCGGAAVVQWLHLNSWVDSPFGMVSILGLSFACGLPAWAIVRWLFNWINKRDVEKAGLDDVVAEVRKQMAGQ